MTEKLTDDERKELDELRAQKNADKENADKEQDNDKPSLPPTHWLWLANGDVIESNGVKSEHDGIPVVAHYTKPDAMVNPSAQKHVF